MAASWPPGGQGEGGLYSNANCRIRNMAVVATRLQIAATATTRSIIKARRPLSVVLNPSAVHPSLLRPSQPPLPSSSLSSSLDGVSHRRQSRRRRRRESHKVVHHYFLVEILGSFRQLLTGVLLPCNFFTFHRLFKFLSHMWHMQQAKAV